jgi:hypothetical protein
MLLVDGEQSQPASLISSMRNGELRVSHAFSSVRPSFAALRSDLRPRLSGLAFDSIWHAVAIISPIMRRI